MKKAIIYIVLIVMAISFLYPFFWMIMASLTPEKQIGSLTFFPDSITFDNYTSMFSKIPIGRALLNSMFVSSVITFGVIMLGSMVGYALAKTKFNGRNFIFYLIIFTMTLPFQITLIPNYITIVKLGWVDQYTALIIPFLINNFAILLFRQSFMSIPQALIDAARIDGCSEIRIIFQVLFPSIIPTIVTVGILTFMTTWNEVLWPLIVVRDEQVMTLPQLVTLFSVGGRADAQLGVKLASAVILALPIMIAYSFFQKYFIQSMASSGIK
ncbi:MAG: carbohydrate ABC transporter permease [Saprospiraceae bacterium]|nr:carbohydrate ABC transporter permease [Bacteroidia bacterium]NNF23099.1 carbohydrate ABC transporter permease [Saprospiraceae bacterium]